jgi:hypothetical protein
MKIQMDEHNIPSRQFMISELSGNEDLLILNTNASVSELIIGALLPHTHTHELKNSM